MYNPQLLYYILDRSCESKETPKKIVNNKFNAIDDFNNMKYLILLRSKMINYLYKKFVRKVVKD